MAWTYLIIAGIFEWGWPVGLKLGLADTGYRWGWIAFAGVCMVVSGALLLVAQKTIPMGTAYAVWTGIGAVNRLSGSDQRNSLISCDKPIRYRSYGVLEPYSCGQYRRSKQPVGALVSPNALILSRLRV